MADKAYNEDILVLVARYGRKMANAAQAHAKYLESDNETERWAYFNQGRAWRELAESDFNHISALLYM